MYTIESLSAESNPPSEDSNRSIGERLADSENIVEEAVAEEEDVDDDKEVASKASDETNSVSSFFDRRLRADSRAFEASVAISESQTTRGEETADHSRESNSAKKQSVTWLFYNFIAPNGADELQPSSPLEK